MSNVHERLKLAIEKNQLTDFDESHIKTQRDSIEKILNDEYGGKIDHILYSGSYGKKTAVRSGYDLDLCIFFKKKSFDTLKEMYEDVRVLLKKNLGTVHRQNVSLRIDRGYGLSVDVVPARIINDEYPDRANLYCRDTDQSITTNIKAQKDLISKSKARPIIKLMKIWRNYHKIDFKSFGMELLTIKAMKSYQGEDDYGKKLRHVMEFTRDYVENVRLEDPGNSNNIVSNAIASGDKTNIKNKAAQALNAGPLFGTPW